MYSLDSILGGMFSAPPPCSSGPCCVGLGSAAMPNCAHPFVARTHTHAHPRTPTGVHRSVCAIGYGSYMKNASTSDGSLSSVPPTCHVLPKSGPDDSCQCVACPHGYGSRGGVINRAECIPQLHFYLRLALTTTEATPACNPAVSAAVTQALADALSKNHDILLGDSSADFLGCCSDSQVCWHMWTVFASGQTCACVRAQIHSRVHTHA